VTFDTAALARANILKLKPYSSAREDFKGPARIHLDANENSIGSPISPALNRYPDPLQRELKEAVSERDGVPVDSIFIGNGSDEVIDLLIRVFCEPRRDAVLICPPTYGMYRVAAELNDVEVREVPLTRDFQLNVERLIEQADQKTKLIFICSPNNPTGNALSVHAIEMVAREVNAIVVVDEAYAEFSDQLSPLPRLSEFPNLVVLRTLSKAFGLAAARVGIGCADPSIVSLLNKVKPPYNVSGLAQKAAIEALRSRMIDSFIRELCDSRESLRGRLAELSIVENVFRSDANFLLVRVDDAGRLYSYLADRGVVVRDRSGEYGCENCLRITVGTAEENAELINALKVYEMEAAAG
jgi:histidinol-phosphate aminotransferase